MINLLLCKNCSYIISQANEIKYFSSNLEIISLKTIPLTVSFEKSKIISSIEPYDIYCIYMPLLCFDCGMFLGKKYVTFNQYLIENCIENSFNTKYIIKKEWPIHGNEINKKNISSEMKVKEKDENDFRCYPIQIFNSFLILPEFLESEYFLQKKHMKLFLKRIETLEYKINEFLTIIRNEKF